MRILLVEDEEKVSRFIVRGLAAEGFAVDAAADGPRGLEGKRQQFAGTTFKVALDEWHGLRVECVGNKIICYYDDEKKIESTDVTFKEAGKIGLWTKADSVTYFDDLRVTAK